MAKDIKDVKTLLEEEYRECMHSEELDGYSDSIFWKESVIKEIYVKIFGEEAFDEFIKRMDHEKWLTLSHYFNW